MPVSTLVRVLIALGVALGVAGDLLVNVAPWGVGVSLWIGLTGAGLWFIVRASRLNLGPRFWLALAGWGATAALFAWREADALKAFNLAALFVLTAFLLCEMQPQSSTPLDWSHRALSRFGAVLWRGFDVLETWVRTRAPGSVETKRRTAAITRGALLSLPVALVFGGLLVSADAAFESLVSRAFVWNIDGETGASHLFGFLVAAWVAIGLLSAPGAGNLMRLVGPATPLPASSDAPSLEGAKGSVRLGLTEIGFVLGTLVFLFGAFVAVQFRYFFAGDAHGPTIAGLTYTEYARKGFFELVWATVLAVPVLLGCGKVCLREGPAGYRVFAGLGSFTVGLLFVIMISAWNRMALYVDAFGLTALRLYACATMIWIGMGLAWMVATYLRRRPALFAPGVAALGALSVYALNGLNPDATIASVNLARAQRTGKLDVEYMRSLSLDAAPPLAAALHRAREGHRESIQQILTSMDANAASRDWRSWTVGRSWAKQAIDRSRQRWVRR